MNFEGYGVAARTGDGHLDEPADLLGQRSRPLIDYLAQGFIPFIDSRKILLERRKHLAQIFHRGLLPGVSRL
jgi:hypothetical protein